MAVQEEKALKETRASVTEEMEQDYERLVDSLKHEHPGKLRMGFLAAVEQ